MRVRGDRGKMRSEEIGGQGRQVCQGRQGGQGRHGRQGDQGRQGDRWSSLVVGGSISEYSGSAPLVSRFLGFLGF